MKLLLHGINSAEKLRTDYSDQPYTIVYPLQTVFSFGVGRLKMNRNLRKVRTIFSLVFLLTIQQNCRGSRAMLDWNHNFEDH